MQNKVKISILLKNIYSVVGYRYFLYLTLMVVTGLIEAVTLSSIIPLLSAIGVGSEIISSSTSISNTFNYLIRTLGFDPTVKVIALVFFLALVLSSFLSLLQSWLGIRLQTQYIFNWQCRLVNSIFKARLDFFYKNSNGNLVNAVITESQRLGGAFYQVGLLLTGLIHGITYFVVAAMLSGSIVLSVVAGGLVLFILNKPLINSAFRVGKGIAVANSELQVSVQDFVTGIKLIKATSTETEAIGQVESIAKRLSDHLFSNSFDIQIAKSVFDFGAAAMVAGILIMSHEFFAVDPAVTLVVLAIFVRLMPKLSGVQQSLQSLGLSTPAVELLSALAKSAEQSAEKSEISDLPKNIVTGALAISVKNVCVSYGRNNVIHDLSLEIPAGGCVALVGPSGSGKSTLVDALLGLVSVQSGGILINSTPLSALPISTFRKRVGYMGQDTILFEGSIRHNLMWGASLKNANIELLTALNLSEAAEFIGQLPSGLDTLINKNGVKLSGGERQRIGLARALMGSPGLLILDEATSSLDAETEALITEALHKLKGRVTILIVAHRLSSVRYADHICLLEKGEIIESGSWENLQKNGTRFSQLWNLQTSV